MRVERLTLRNRFLAGTAATAFAVSLGAGTATAQVADIVVMAQKRSEKLQDVPIAITAISSEGLEKSVPDANFLDLALVTPGLDTQAVYVGYIARIRGIGHLDTTPGNESPVSMYVDGVYIPGASAPGLMSLSNIDRVEVLKGPQGTLFGRNTTGGVIQVITKDPSKEDTGGNLSFTYGNYATKVASGYVTLRLNDDIGTDLAFRWSDQANGWGRNLITDKEIYKNEKFAIRNKWVINAGPATKISIAGDYSRNRNDGPTYRLKSDPGFFDINQNMDSVVRSWTWGVSLNVEHEFDFAKLVSITSYRKVRTYIDADIDYSPAPLLEGYYPGYQRAVTQEIQLQSPDASKLKWIVGGFFMRRTAELSPSGQYGTFYNFYPIPGGWTATGQDSFSHQRTLSFAGFAQASYPVLEDTNLTLGIRYTTDKQKFRGTGYIYYIPGSGTGAPPYTSTDFSDSKKSDKVTYRIVLDHHFSENVMGYVSWNTGYKSGYFGLLTVPSTANEPEYLKAYEIGIKSELFDKRLRLNMSAYHYDISNLQTFFVQRGIATVINAGHAKIDGFEVEATANPVPDWNIHFGLNWMPRAKYTEFSPCPGPTLFFDPQTFDCSGSRMAQAPKWEVNLGTDYTFHTSIGALNFAATYKYSGRFPWEGDFGPINYKASPPYFGAPYSTEVLKENSHSFVNVQAAWTSPSDTIRIAAWAKNLTNTHYLVSGTKVPGWGIEQAPGAPRTYGVTLGYKF